MTRSPLPQTSGLPASAPHDVGTLLPGRWFDGLSSKARPVMVGLRRTARGPSLVLHPVGGPGAVPIILACHEVGWPEAWNLDKPPQRVVVDLRERGSLEIDAVADWRAALATAGERPGLAQRMQTRWTVLLGVGVAAAIGLTLFYRYGTPWTATQLTRWVPLSWETRVADNVLRQMDEGTLKPSKLPPERQAQLQARFDALVQQTPATMHRYPHYKPPLRLAFRAGMGANAFALPGGKVVMTDGIVKAAAENGLGDDALVGVLAHEIGHVMYRHTTRMVVEQGVLNLGLGLALGDVSAVVSTSASVLTGLAYSRNHEREADCYAIALMRHAGLPTAPMGKLLLAIARDEKKREARQEQEESDHKAARKDTATSSAPDSQAAASSPAPDARKPRPRADDGPEHAVWSLLSSHPGTIERATELEQGHAPHCGKS